MNPITDLIFTLSWFILLVWAIRTMAKGWGAMNTSTSSYNGEFEVGKVEVKRPMHPEMAEVKTGDELLVVNFEKEPEPQDPLYKSMQDRIQTLKDEEGTTEIEDDDDDDSEPEPSPIPEQEIEDEPALQIKDSIESDDEIDDINLDDNIKRLLNKEPKEKKSTKKKHMNIDSNVLNIMSQFV